jgi:hypothetical protein
VDLTSLAAEFDAYVDDPGLADETRIADRARALDLIALIGELAQHRPRDRAVRNLLSRADAFATRLQEIDEQIYARLREAIRSGQLCGPSLRAELNRFTAYRPEQSDALHFTLDGLDVLWDGVLDVRHRPPPSFVLEPEMVHYWPTPVRVIFDLIDHAGIGPNDRFCDLGSGLGGVVLLVALLLGIPATGVEIDPAYCAFARERAGILQVPNAAFICADARTADYASATTFFLFTPFRGAVLAAVLARLRDAARRQPITVCSFGPITPTLFGQPWLRAVDPSMNHEFRLASFRSD